MTEKINQLRSTVGDNTAPSKNFSELNFKETYIWPNKIARTFFNVDLTEEYGQLGSREYPSYFYIRTESKNIYKVFKPTYENLRSMTKGDDAKCKEILWWPTARCLYNSQTRKITGIENSNIRCGDIFKYAPQCNTSEVKEIVGVSDGIWESSKKNWLSTIELQFKNRMK